MNEPDTPRSEPEERDDSIAGLDLGRYAEVDRLCEAYRQQLGTAQGIEAEAFAARYPELEALLLPALRALDTLQRNVSPVPPAHVEVGDRLGGFTIVRELGRGGMGIVYEAIEENLPRTVALKVLDGARTSEAFRSRFQREARAAARLEHPAIVPVYGTGEDGGLLWYAMRRIDGPALDAWLSGDSKLPAGVALRDDSSGSATVGAAGEHHGVARLGQRLAGALAYAHAGGVLHRDLKPGNVLLDLHGDAYLTDFGLCKLEGEASITEASDIVGTLRYLPPEAFRGVIDARGDVYGLGLVLYELLARQPAFPRADRARLVEDIQHRDPPALVKVDRQIPVDLARIVAKAIAKLPEERYASAAALEDDLGRYLAGRPIHARALGLGYSLRLLTRRHRAAVLVAVACALLLVAGAAVYVVQLRGLLTDVRFAQRQAERGEAVALLGNASARIEAGDIPGACELLGRVSPADRDWPWAHLQERSSYPVRTTWLPMKQPMGVGELPTGEWYAWNRDEIQIIDPVRLRRLESLVARNLGTESGGFRGVVPSGIGRGLMVASGRSSALHRWSGASRDDLEFVAELPGVPQLLRARLGEAGQASVGAVLAGGYVLRFDLSRGRELGRTDVRERAAVSAMEVLASGDVAIADRSGALLRIDAESGAVTVIDRHRAAVEAILVRGDEVLASGDVSGAVRFHPTGSLGTPRDGIELSSAVRCLRLGDRDDDAWAGLASGSLVELRLGLRAAVASHVRHPSAVLGILKRGDGERASVSVLANVQPLDQAATRGRPGSGPVAAAAAATAIDKIAFAPDGGAVAFMSGSGLLQISGEPGVIVAAESLVAPVRFDARGELVSTGGLVVDSATGRELLRWWPPLGTVFASFWSGTELILVTQESATGRPEDSVLGVWRWDSDRPERQPIRTSTASLPAGWGRAPASAFDPASRTLFLAEWFGAVQAIDVDTLDVRWVVQPRNAGALTMIRDPHRSQLLLATGSRDLLWLDERDGAEVVAPATELSLAGRRLEAVVHLALSPDGRLALTGDAGGGIGVWSYPEGRQLLTLDRKRSPAYFPTFTPDGRWIAFASADGLLEILGHGEPPAWARGGLALTRSEASLALALEWARERPQEPERLLVAARLVAYLGRGRLFDSPAPVSPDGDHVLARIRRALGPLVDRDALMRLSERALDVDEVQLGRFGFTRSLLPRVEPGEGVTLEAAGAAHDQPPLPAAGPR